MIKEEVNGKDIASGSEKIAKFMEFPYDDPDQFEIWDHEKETFVTGTIEDLEYSTSWEWLMPVWYKFRDLKFENGKISDEHELFTLAISVAIVYKCKDSPEPAFNELVKGIEWYNSIKS